MPSRSPTSPPRHRSMTWSRCASSSATRASSRSARTPTSSPSSRSCAGASCGSWPNAAASPSLPSSTASATASLQTPGPRERARTMICRPISPRRSRWGSTSHCAGCAGTTPQPRRRSISPGSTSRRPVGRCFRPGPGRRLPAPGRPRDPPGDPERLSAHPRPRRVRRHPQHPDLHRGRHRKLRDLDLNAGTSCSASPGVPHSRRPRPEFLDMLLTIRSREDATEACEESDQ